MKRIDGNAVILKDPITNAYVGLLCRDGGFSAVGAHAGEGIVGRGLALSLLETHLPSPVTILEESSALLVTGGEEIGVSVEGGMFHGSLCPASGSTATV